MTDRTIENQTITETQNFPNLLTGVEIGTWQASYMLREVEFERIKHGKPITYNWANSIALTSFGFALNLFAKGYSDLSVVSEGEWRALAVGVVISLVLYCIGLALPDKRKRVMKDIETHFRNAPTKQQLHRGQNI